MKLPKPFKERDIEYMPNSMKIVRSTDITHYGIGCRVVMEKGIDFGNMASLVIGNKGIGKTKSIEALARISHREIFDEEVTLAAFDRDLNEKFSNNSITWLSKDLAKVSDEVVKGMFRVVCSLVYDHECKVKTSMYRAGIENATISFLGACTPDKFETIQDMPEYQQMHSDRLIRFWVFALTRKSIQKNVPWTKMLKPKSNFPLQTQVRVVKDSLWDEVKDMFEWQLTDERAEENTDNLLSGLARMNFRRRTRECDAKFVLLHSFNFRCEAKFGKRDYATGPLTVETDGLYYFGEALKRGSITVDWIEERRSMRERQTILDTLEECEDMLDVSRGGVIRAKESIVRKNIKPQLQFEKFMYKMAPEFLEEYEVPERKRKKRKKKKIKSRYRKRRTKDMLGPH